MPAVSLVTVLFNSDDVLDGFFKSLGAQTFTDYHLYMIDNTVKEDTNKLIAELTQKYGILRFTHIKNTENLGIAKGNNQGILESLKNGSTYTLLLNNDIEFEQPNLLLEIYNRALKHQETLVIPKIKYYDTGRIWMAGGIFQHLKGTNIHVGDNELDSHVHNLERYFDYAPTCFMLIENSVIKTIGLMDEKYFVYYDDMDFILRASRVGYKVFYYPGLEVLHKVSTSTGGLESLFSIYYSNRNRIYFLRKNYSGINYLIPISFTLITRVFKYFRYEKDKREKLLSAIIDGFKM